MRDNFEVLDFVKNHLLTQGQPARNASGHCVYRNTANLSCAVGCLISDEHYHASLEGNGIEDWDVLHAVTRSLGFEPDTEMLTELQKIHDFHAPSEWPRLLGELTSDTKAALL